MIVAEWPENPLQIDNQSEVTADFAQVRELIRGIRGVRSEYGVEPGRFVPATIIAQENYELIKSQEDIIAFLARLDKENLHIINKGEVPENSVTVTAGIVTAYLPLADLIDLEKERIRLRDEINELESQIKRVSKLLEGDFSERAPAKAVDRERVKLAQYQASHAELTARIQNLK